MNQQKIEDFLKELAVLSEKHGIFINDGSCGCCDYTHMVDREGKRLCHDMILYYNKDEKEYVSKVNKWD